MQSKATSVDAYLAEQPQATQVVLKTLRDLIRHAAPDVEERMAHGMPAYLRDGEMLFAFAAQKQNFSLYCCDTQAVSRFATKLKAKNIGKSCIRFKALAELDLGAVETMLKAAQKSG